MPASQHVETNNSNPQIITPDYDLTRRIQELGSDIKYSTVLGVGSLAAAGTIGTDAVLRVTGNGSVFGDAPDQVGPAWLLDPLATAATVGAGLRIGVDSFSQRKERRELRRQERDKKFEAIRHYQQNQALYRGSALRDARTAGIEINQ